MLVEKQQKNESQASAADELFRQSHQKLAEFSRAQAVWDRLPIRAVSDGCCFIVLGDGS